MLDCLTVGSFGVMGEMSGRLGEVAKLRNCGRIRGQKDRLLELLE